STPDSVQVEGHTDNVPIASAQFPSNWELASARASSVVRLFVTSGVNPARLTATGYAENRPVETNDTQEGRARNRRVTLLIIAARNAEAARAHEQPNQEIQDRRRTEQSLRYSETLLRRLHEDLEDHIAERTVELTKTIAELEAFSYSISHDLRAPLRAINGFAAILRDEHADRLASDGDALLMKIETNASKMAQLIDGLLDFSRLARAESMKTEIDMTSLATSVVQELAGEEGQRRAAVEVAPLPRAMGDEATVRQGWTN